MTECYEKKILFLYDFHKRILPPLIANPFPSSIWPMISHYAIVSELKKKQFIIMIH